MKLNPAFEKILGLNAAEVTDRTLSEVLPQALHDSADWIKKYGEVALSGKDISFEQYSDSLNKWYLIHSFSPKRGEFAVIFSDVTDRHSSEKKLAESELKFRSIFNHASIGISIMETATGRYINVNRKQCEMLGRSEEEMLALDFMTITHRDDLAEDLINMKKLVSGEIEGFSMTKRYIHKNKTSVWVRLNVTRLWFGDEKPLFHLAVCEDITELKVREQQTSCCERKTKALRQ